jgi:hypothetical protein
MATLVTSLTSAEVANHVGVADPPTYTNLKAAALRKLQAQLPAYAVTKVEVSQVGAAALKFTITYTEKPLQGDKAKAALKH